MIRTVNHTKNDHNGTHIIQTGFPIPPADRGAAMVAATDKDLPAYGSVISYLDQAGRNGTERQRAAASFPGHVYLPRLLGHVAGYDINGQYAGWLGSVTLPP
ncbi:MAG: hypothetical protein ACYTGL_22660 [Planctomycetota bacterium]